MARLLRAAAAGALLLGVIAFPALAQEDGGQAVIDVSEFITRGTDFVDRNGDGVPDLGELAEGWPGIWDDLVGAQTPEEFQELVIDRIPGFDTSDEGSTMVGACGGLAISYDRDGLSIDAMVDNGDGDPIVDVYSGGQAMTADNPFEIDPSGVIAYWGFTRDLPNFSTAGEIAGVNYQDPAPAFHDHSWSMLVMGISTDRGGDPNQRDKNRNAGLVIMDEVFEDVNVPLFDIGELNLTFKAKGAIIDLYAEGDPNGRRLPDDFDLETIEAEAMGREFCFGEGWAAFIGSGPPLTVDIVAAALMAAGFAGLMFNVRPAQSWRASGPPPSVGS